MAFSTNYYDLNAKRNPGPLSPGLSLRQINVYASATSFDNSGSRRRDRPVRDTFDCASDSAVRIGSDRKFCAKLRGAQTDIDYANTNVEIPGSA